MNFIVGKDWRDLFDVVIVQADKPNFFNDKRRYILPSHSVIPDLNFFFLLPAVCLCCFSFFFYRSYGSYIAIRTSNVANFSKSGLFLYCYKVVRNPVCGWEVGFSFYMNNFWLFFHGIRIVNSSGVLSVCGSSRDISLSEI